MKYIDADKLKKVIKEKVCKRKEWLREPFRSDRQDQLWIDLNGEDMSILSLIDSLQQEQPVVQNGKFVFPKYLYARTKDNKTIDMSYVPQDMTAIEYVRNDFIQQEQPEVDLEKEIDRWFEIARDDEGWAHVSSKDGTICDDWKKSDYIMNKPSFYGFARHFYEFGLNARKEK